jgi:ubiquinol-cytochrome c reductase cytochrome c1 subunit
LAWAAEPEHDERKKFGVKSVTVLLIAFAITGYYKRLRWAPLKSRKITYMDLAQRCSSCCYDCCCDS